MKTPDRFAPVEAALAQAHQNRAVPPPSPGWQKRVMAGLRLPGAQAADEATPLFVYAAYATTALSFCFVMTALLAGWHQPTDSLAWLWLGDASSIQTLLLTY
ncbi:MAG TPA: hypothetical protein DCZ95_14380 [Verrucomicrobia bacterium]|nr:MAG: hypothetical protein A2X46_03515 [Lentisphaerae bacterium GWF2_57_35]HBA85271.1 hypothetical protein [Verrucomicrobiota bacterium]